MKFFWQRKRREEPQSAFGASSTFGASSMALLMAAPLASEAGAQQVSLSVAATVLKRASVTVLAQPVSVVVTEEDVARGYVDASAPAQVAIRSNSSLGYFLEFASAGDFMRQIVVRGLASEVQLSPAGGAVMQPYTGSGITRTTLDLGFRFVLAEGARPGTYSWPMRFSVTPI